jgi:hypothetical protein
MIRKRKRRHVVVWWKSRVLWLNALAGVASTGVILFEPIRTMMPMWAGALCGLALAGANAFLRFVTTDPISMRQVDDRLDPENPDLP